MAREANDKSYEILMSSFRADDCQKIIDGGKTPKSDGDERAARKLGNKIIPVEFTGGDEINSKPPTGAD
ncbi:MAG TPA: hypothetical protein VJI33_03130 [Candidatus Paceibacterota bacterium]